MTSVLAKPETTTDAGFLAKLAVVTLVIAVVVGVGAVAILALAAGSPRGSSARPGVPGTILPASSPYLRVFGTDWKPLVSLDRRRYVDCYVNADFKRCQTTLARDAHAQARILADLSAIPVPHRLTHVTAKLEAELRTYLAGTTMLARDIARNLPSKYMADRLRYPAEPLCINPLNELIETPDTPPKTSYSETLESSDPIPALPYATC